MQPGDAGSAAEWVPEGRSKSEVALSFSGGLDTTLASVLLLEQFERLHLLTFCNGYCSRLSAPEGRVKKLRELFGRDRVIHHTIDTAGLLKDLLGDYTRALRRYGSPLLFDLCCRWSMELRSILYCLEHGIEYAADGLNPEQPMLFMLETEYLRHADRFAAEYRVRMLHPVYHYGSRTARRAELKRRSLNDEARIITFLQRHGLFLQISDQIRSQPFCFAQVPIFLMTSGLRRLPLISRLGLSLEDALAFRKEREPRAKEIVQERLSRLGLDLSKEVEARGVPADPQDRLPYLL